MLGLDYSAGRPSGAAIIRAGYRFVVRYLPNGLSGRVNLTAAEAAGLRAAGVAVALVWERKLNGQPDRATEGYAAGAADARAADAAAVACGLDGFPIYMAIDFDIPDYAPKSPDPHAKLGPVGDYLAGAASVLGRTRTGVYGGFYAVSRAIDAGLVSLAWQTVAWSGGNVDPRVHLLQRLGRVVIDGIDCDTNESRQTYFGQGPASTPASAPTREDDDMWKFLVDDATVQGDGSYMRCAELLPTAELIGTTWDDIAAKVAEAKAGGAPASVRGLKTTVFDDYERNSNAHKAATANLAKLTSGAGGPISFTLPVFDLSITGTATPKEA